MNSTNYLKIPGASGANAFGIANIETVVCTLKPAQTPSKHNVKVYASGTHAIICDQEILTSDVPNVVAQLPTFKQGGTNASGDVTLVNTALIRDAVDTADQTTVTFHYASGAICTGLTVASSDAFYA